MKICVYAVAKNEAQFVERFCESAKEADLIMIGDTGSTDDTVKKVVELKMPNVACFAMHVSPWRFDMARNAVLSLIPADTDVCVSLDLDEVLQPGWRQEIERVWKPGETTRLGYMFDWGIGVQFRYEKIHQRNGYTWHHPCHEYPMPYMIEEKFAETEMLLVVHKPDSTKSRAQYLPLLKMSIEEDPSCPRNAFYYARELGFYGQWDESIAQAYRYLALPRATWPNERCYAYRVIGRAWMEKGELGKAEQALFLGATEAPETREPWVELAKVMYKQGRWPECFAHAMRALSITYRQKLYTVDPGVWGGTPHMYASLGAWNMGMKPLALEHAKKAVELEPTNELFVNNVVAIERNM